MGQAKSREEEEGDKKRSEVITEPHPVDEKWADEPSLAHTLIVPQAVDAAGNEGPTCPSVLSTVRAQRHTGRKRRHPCQLRALPAPGFHFTACTLTRRNVSKQVPSSRRARSIVRRTTMS